MRISKSISFVPLLGFLVACVSPQEQIKMLPVANKWQSTEVKAMDFEITDHQLPKDITIVLRNNNEYPYSNIRFFVRCYSKESKQQTKVDTLNYVIANPDGTWIGKGFGSTKEIGLQYQNGYHFPKNGVYHFDIVQAMRKSPLVGIEDIGIKVETSK